MISLGVSNISSRLAGIRDELVILRKSLLNSASHGTQNVGQMTASDVIALQTVWCDTDPMFRYHLPPQQMTGLLSVS